MSERTLDYLEEVQKQLAAMTKRATEAEGTVKSLSTMMGWMNVPPRPVLERSLQALKSSNGATFTHLKQERADLLAMCKPYMQHVGGCSGAHRSSYRPCNCGVLDILGPDENELEKRRTQPEYGPFPSVRPIFEYVAMRRDIVIAMRKFARNVSVRISFIGHPGEPTNQDGPDWSDLVKEKDRLAGDLDELGFEL